MFTMYTTQISTASPSASFVWNGITWNPVGGTANVAAESGSTPATGVLTVNGTESDIVTVTLPSAGKYEVNYDIEIGNPGASANLLTRFVDNTTTTVPGSDAALIAQTGFGQPVQINRTFQVTVTQARVYRLRASIGGGSSTTVNNAQTSVSWNKISGNAPVSCQTVDAGVFAPSGSGLVSGSTVTLASTTGNIAVAGNLFTLKAGKTYQVRAALRFSSYTGNFVFFEIENAAGTRQGTAALQFRNTSTAYTESDQQEAYALIKPLVDTQYKIAITTVETGSIQIAGGESFVSVVQLGNSAIIGGLTAGLNQITAATGLSTIDNLNYAQTWNWGTATTQTGLMALTANTLTTGGLMDLSTSSNAFTSNTGLLSVRNMGTSTTGVLANFQASGINQGLKVFNNGVVGIGTSVAAPLWSNARQVLMLGDTGSVAGASNLAYLANNWYFDGANDRRITTNPVTRMEQLNGGFNFQTAASGAANSVINFTTAQSFENNGRSNFNTASGATNIPTVSQAQVQISAASGTDGLNIRGAVGNNIINLYAPTTGVTTLLSFRNDQGGAGSENGKIAMTTTTTSYLTASDQRLKTDTGVTAKGLSDLLKIDVHNFKWKSSGEIQNGFYAQQLQTVVPEAVVIGGDEVDANGKLTNPWAVDYGRVTPILVKSIQELNVKVDALAGLDIKTVVKQLDEMKGLQSQNDAAFADIRASLSKLDTRVTSLEKAKAAQDATNTTQEVKLEALQVQLDALKKKIEASSSSAITK